jgi:hypothetical protein
MYDVWVSRKDTTSTRRFVKISHVCSNTIWLTCAVKSYYLTRASRSRLLSRNLRVREHLKGKTTEHDMYRIQAENYCCREFTYNRLLIYNLNCSRTSHVKSQHCKRQGHGRTISFSRDCRLHTRKSIWKKTPPEQRAFFLNLCRIMLQSTTYRVFKYRSYWTENAVWCWTGMVRSILGPAIGRYICADLGGHAV